MSPMKHNSYFEGKVQSLGVNTPDGPATRDGADPTPDPAPEHGLPDQLLELHTPRQLIGLGAILDDLRKPAKRPGGRKKVEVGSLG